MEIRWRGGEKTEQLDNLRSIELRAVQERKQKDDPTKKKRTILNECPQYDKCLRNRKVGLTSTNKQTEPKIKESHWKLEENTNPSGTIVVNKRIVEANDKMATIITEASVKGSIRNRF